MKYALLATIVAISFSATAQKIKKSEVDKFTKQKRIETTDVSLKAGLYESMITHIRSVDSTCFMIFAGTGNEAQVIGDDDKLIMLLDNDSTITALSTGIQDYNIYTNHRTYSHQYEIALDDIETISSHDVKSIRKYTAKGYVDFDVPEKKKAELKQLCLVFLAELRK
jgi:hypothetical protein